MSESPRGLSLRRAWDGARAHPYASAAVAPLAALGLVLVLREPIQGVTPTPFLIAIALAAWQGRWRAASFAVLVCTAMLAGLFFIGDATAGVPELLRLGLFVVVSSAIVWLFEKVISARERDHHQTNQLLAQAEQMQRQAVELETQTKELEETLNAQLRSENRYRLLYEAVHDGIVMHDRKGAIIAANASALRILGLTSQQILSRTQADSSWKIIREDGTPFPGDDLPATVALRTGEAQRGVVMGVERPSGERRWLITSANPRDDAHEMGRVVIVSFTDVTELLESRRTLRETEAKLRQAQKMEAVGQLAGGIAHDFNNLLTVITGFSELLALDIPADSPRRSDLDEITKAATRAADLTHQLLAFSRKQVLQPRRVNVNATVESMGRMLARLIGEDVEVVTQLAKHVEEISVDPGQLEQVIANLAVNARDAMPDGGVLLIETSNVQVETPRMADGAITVPQGVYVRLLVSDTGVGMNSAVLERIFEPFFTTKEAGRGTGLGLSTVYGIVKQTGGHIAVESVPGAGARFELFFPVLPAALSKDSPIISGEHALPPPGGRILLVEDEDAVRTATRRILQRDGYTVLEASNASEALAIAAKYNGEIDLLLTDLVMPGMRGTDLAHEVMATHPQIRILVMSGYSEETSNRQWSLPPNVTLLEKPFSASSLARRVREVLGR